MDSLEQEQAESSRQGPALARPIKWGDSILPEQTAADFILPVGTITLLMADLEGSTALWESAREQMAGSIARHDEIVSQALARFGGVRPKDQGEGDSFIAAFSRASDAVACALEIQINLERQVWEDTPLHLRIALHTGEVQLRDVGNYIGQTVNRAARLRSTAHGGQTVLSQATYELVVDKMPSDATLKDLGTHRLRDLTRAEHIYQLSHPALTDDFPPLRSLDTHPHNLPIQLSSFVGREQVIEQIKRQLSETRLLTLSGSGGCGKTRLALQVAGEVMDDFPDGVWLAELGSLVQPSEVQAAVAGVLPVPVAQQQPSLEKVARAIADKRMLIILDNCEHVVEACARAAEILLKSCPGIAVMATSREPLQIPGETSWRVPSMVLPEETVPPTIESLAQYEAVQLFIERAMKARPNFLVTNDNAPAIAGICQRLDGIPLAIELAAARVRMLTPDQIADGLSDRFRLLTAGARTAMPRQQTLRASVDWSFDHLTEREQILFRRVGVFTGGFTLTACEEVCSGNGLESNEILDVLSQLVEKSLVAVEGEASRYRLLETVRQYALERLSESEEEQTTRVRHRDFYMWFSEKVIEETWGRDHERRKLLLSTEQANLYAARELSRDRNDRIELMRLTLAIVHGLGIFIDPRWFEEALETEGEHLPLLRGRLLATQAEQGMQRGDPVTWSAANEAIEILRQLDDKAWVSASLAVLGWLNIGIDRNQSEAFFKEAIDLAREAKDPWREASALIGLGTMYSYAKDGHAAKPLLEEAREIGLSSGAPGLVRTAETWLAPALTSMGQPVQARAMLEKIVAADPNISWSFVELNLAWTLVHMGEYEEAKRFFERGIELGREWSPLVASWSHTGLLWLTMIMGRPSEALRMFHDPNSPPRVFTSPAQAIGEKLFQAEAHRLEGDFVRSRHFFEEALSEARDAGLKGMTASLQHGLSLLEKAEGNIHVAEELAHGALGHWSTTQDFVWISVCLETVSELKAIYGEFEKAARLIGTAESLQADMGWVRAPAYREDHERLRSSIVQAVGEEASGSLLAKGAAMTPEEAVSYAQRGRGERKRPSAGWESLTPMEIEVAKLVGQGLSNPEIGERLFISKRTVQTHLSRAFGKLGLSKRSELAAEVARRGLLGQ